MGVFLLYLNKQLAFLALSVFVAFLTSQNLKFRLLFPLMDLVSPVIDIFTRLWDCTANSTAPICHLDKNIKSFTDQKRELDSLYADIKQRVEREKENYKILLQVENWLAEAETLIKEVEAILHQGNEQIQNKCLGSCCPRSCRASYRIGKEVIEKIDTMQKLTSKGHFDVVAADRLPRPAVDKILVEKTVDMDRKETEVWKLIEDGSVGIIGLCGMGGVGKTTLLKKLNNKFIHTAHTFDVVIWVTVSSEMKLEKIQNAIRKKLEIPDDKWETLDENSRPTEIHTKLSSKTFVLLLDDVWEPIDRIKVGIPLPNDQNRSKIILTTRSEKVCRIMGVDQGIYNVRPLSQEAALELFRQKVTEDVLNYHSHIPELAKTVAEECKGLPLALITIGSAMRSKKEPAEWRTAIDQLKNYPSELFTDMGKDIFHILKFSYDSLNDDLHKNCFLYCSMFPEDREIRKDELIELWIAEGFLNKYGSLDKKRDRGEDVIGSLKLASLLERVDDSEHRVKMHDVLRDMALCISSKEGKEIVVYDDCKSIQEREEDGWQSTVRISLWGYKIKELPRLPYCRNLHTFLARETSVRTFPNGFFQSTHDALKVLDLQGNFFVWELPHDVSKLINLQYLNLSDSGVKVLPIEVKGLTKLRILLLDGTRNLECVPEGVISNLLSLQVFSRLSTASNPLEYGDFWETPLLEELKCLEHIREIGLTLFTLNSVHQFKSSDKLRSCVKRLTVACPDLLSLDISPSTMNPADYFRNLQDMYIANCSVKDLTCLKHSPLLRFVFADNCSLLEEIIACDFGSSGIEEQMVFQHLKQLNFRSLPRLKSICRQILSFPSLERIYVKLCPNLRKLPLKSVLDGNTNTSASIVGGRDWWNQLEWEDEATKRAFSSKHLPLDFNSRPSYTYEATVIDKNQYDMKHLEWWNQLGIQRNRVIPRRGQIKERILRSIFIKGL